MKQYWAIFSYFFFLGLFTFGGGLAMIPSMKTHSLAQRWVIKSQWDDILTIAQLSPGAIAINLAHLLGRSFAGIVGGIVAIIAIILPSIIVILLLVSGMSYVLSLPAIVSAFKGVFIVATILIVQAWIEMAKPLISQPFLYGITVIVFSLLIFNVLSPLIVMASLLVLVTIVVILFAYRKPKP